MNAPLEIEVKFLVRDREEIRKTILSLGAESLGRVFEKNTVYDDDAQSLRRQGRLLRLRVDRRALLTTKEPPERPDPDVKVYIENEVSVDDPEAMDRILRCLGFSPRLVYEKWREEFTLEKARLMLDELPFGCFLEIEADRDAIRSLAGRIALPWEQRIKKTYLALFADVKTRKGLAFTDLSFENFAGINVAPEEMLDLWQQE